MKRLSWITVSARNPEYAPASLTASVRVPTARVHFCRSTLNDKSFLMLTNAEPLWYEC